MLRRGAVLAGIVSHSGVAHGHDHTFRCGALGFEASSAEAGVFLAGAIVLFRAYGNDVADMRTANRALGATIQSELEFGVALDEVPVAHVRDLEQLGVDD